MQSIPTDKIIAEVAHHDLLPFLRPQLKLNRIWGVAYWLINVLIISYIVWLSLPGRITFEEFSDTVGFGFMLFILTLPIHEGIHALAYKIAGAPTIGFGADWKKLIFYAVADQFVVGYRKFIWVALSPFIVINIILLALSVMLPTYALLFLGIVLLHTAGCFGDFALVSFMHHHRSRHIQTMDEVSQGKTYFFEGAPN